MNQPAQQSSNWQQTILVTALLCLALLALFYPTAAAMVDIWWRSETFAHGFFILPITLFLIWRLRDELRLLTPQPTMWGLPLLVMLGFGWLLAHFASVAVVQQLAFVAMLPVIVFSMLGWQVTRRILFPLCFLVLAVPMGEGLIPPMMDFTADFTVMMLQLTGIPVFREGLFFEIPSGRWSVVEGCSGVRYLIAAVTLGCLYAYLTYRSIYRRLVFVAISFIVPVIANGLRAYMIVMIAHFSDNKLAHGVDHFIYGWVFFGFVMMLLFWIGSFWREDESKQSDGVASEQSAGTILAKPASHKSTLTAACAIFLVLSVWPVWAYINSQQGDSVVVSLNVPDEQSGWYKASQPLTEWRPRYLGMDAELEQTYIMDGRKVGLYLAYYSYQRQDAELVNTQNVMITQKHPVWHQVGNQQAKLSLNGEQIPIRKAKLRSSAQNLRVYYWDWFAGEYAANAYAAKLLEVKRSLLGQRKDAAGIIIATEFEEETADAEALIESFITNMYPAIEASLNEASASLN